MTGQLGGAVGEVGFVSPGDGALADHMEQAAEMQKALSVGSGSGVDASGGRAVVPESLEPTLRVLTTSDRDFKNSLWSILKRNAQKAEDVTHQFATVRGRGRTGIFHGERSEDVNNIDPLLKREHVDVRFARFTYQLNHVMKFTRTLVNEEALQIKNATLTMMELIERALYMGDPTMVSSEPRGLAAIVAAGAPANHVIDKNGAELDAEDYRLAAERINDGFGQATHSFHSNSIQRSLDNALEGNKDRISLVDMGNGVLQPLPAAYLGGPGALTYGAPAEGLRTSWGHIKFSPHKFVGMHQSPATDESGAEVKTSTSAPETPTVALAAAVDASSRLPAGTYRVRVSAEDKNGESIPSVSQTVVVAAGERINLTLTKNVAGAVPSCYRVYISAAGGAAGTEKARFRVAYTGSPMTFQYNAAANSTQVLPNTEDAYVVDMGSNGEDQALAWAQLSDMLREPLARVTVTYPFLVFLYGVLCCYKPRGIVRFKNVGLPA